MSNSPHIVGIIPARYPSVRFPGKILTPICGRPLIQWVIERVQQAKTLDEVVVATDDERICEAVRAVGGRAVMTRPDHPSGTDRVAEAVAATMLANEMETVLHKLPAREALIMRLRYGLQGNQPHTLKEISEMLHLSRERIRQLENEILGKLRQSDFADSLQLYLN